MTSEVPRSGWMSTSMSGGPASSTAPTMVHRLVIRAWWLAIQVASTMAIRTLATSENWNWSPRMVDPARDATDAGAHGEGQQQQTRC